MADQGERGERGPHGDHGQQGDTGDEGAVGPEGPKGAAGLEGPVGPVGRIMFNRRQTLALFLSVILVGVLMAARTEINQRAIRRNTQAIAVSQYTSCVGRVSLVKRVNAAARELVELERTQTPHSPDAERRISAYKSLLTLPEPAIAQCGPRP